jgi:hypothetical protein
VHRLLEGSNASTARISDKEQSKNEGVRTVITGLRQESRNFYF